LEVERSGAQNDDIKHERELPLIYRQSQDPTHHLVGLFCDLCPVLKYDFNSLATLSAAFAVIFTAELTGVFG